MSKSRKIREFLLRPDILISLVIIAVAALATLTDIGIFSSSADARYQEAIIAILSLLASVHILNSYSSAEQMQKVLDSSTQHIQKVLDSSTQQTQKVLDSLAAKVGARLEGILVSRHTPESLLDGAFPDDWFVNHRDFTFIGVSQRQVLVDNETRLEHVLSTGGTVRFVVAARDNQHLMDLLARNTAHFHKNDVKDDIEETIRLVRRLDSHRENKGTLQLYFLDAFPTLSLTLMDAPGSEIGKIIVELYPFKVKKSGRYHFLVSRLENPAHYERFHGIIEEILKEAELVNINTALGADET